MDSAELANATWWSSFWDTVESWAFLGVVVALAVEFAAHWFVRPYKEEIEVARKAEIVRLQSESAKLTKEAEELRARNLALQQALAPRILEQGQTAAALRRFSDMQWSVDVIGDREAERTAGQIRWMLRAAGWKKFEGELRPITFRDGVFVYSVTGAEFPRASDAAEELVRQLNAGGVPAQLGFPISLPDPRVIRVIIGLKPLPKELGPAPEGFPGDARGNVTYGNTSAE